jgi:hypothetical protein
MLRPNGLFLTSTSRQLPSLVRRTSKNAVWAKFNFAEYPFHALG